MILGVFPEFGALNLCSTILVGKSMGTAEQLIKS